MAGGCVVIDWRGFTPPRMDKRCLFVLSFHQLVINQLQPHLATNPISSSYPLRLIIASQMIP